jgi:Ca-activated chloride channel family protein
MMSPIRKTSTVTVPALALLAATMLVFGSGCEKQSPRAVTPLPGGRAGIAHVNGGPSGLTTGGLQTDPRWVGLLDLPGVMGATRAGHGASVPVGAEEFWVVARAAADNSPNSVDRTPGAGELRTRLAPEKEEVPLPLRHTEVNASVHGYIGAVEVKQEFHNPYDTKIEAVYVFPLPHNSAVSDFVMTIGERHIRGIIRERQEAETIYQQAKSQGYVASLLTEERPNIFRQAVANIEPGKQIDVNLTYYETLAYVDGWYEFVFPMVVGPRYNPQGLTNGVGAVARNQAGSSGQNTEVEYLKPTERSGHDIALRLEVDAGVAIEEFTCATHKITRETSAAGRLVVALAENDQIPNKDFVLRYRVAGEQIKSDLIASQDGPGGYFTLMLFPPRDLTHLARAPMEMIFVLDCSGSMSGLPIEQAKAAIGRALGLLRQEDSFQIINFSERASRLGDRPLPATPANVSKGLDYVAALNGDGPTAMIEGIKAALDFPHDPQRLRFVSFMTDGFIGNEAEILAAVRERLGASRIFSFGVGSSPNRYLLDQLATLGQGAAAYLGLHDDASRVMENFFERISHPALADLKLEWGQMQVSEVYPSRVPDLFVGRPVILTGRLTGGESSAIRVLGKAGGRDLAFEIPVNVNQDKAADKALANVWARAKIAELAERSVYEANAQLPAAIKQVALDYGLMSAFTAFLAVDTSQTTQGDAGVTVPVAVPVPEGVEYETTVQEQQKNQPK